MFNVGYRSYRSDQVLGLSVQLGWDDARARSCRGSPQAQGVQDLGRLGFRIEDFGCLIVYKRVAGLLQLGCLGFKPSCL